VAAPEATAAVLPRLRELGYRVNEARFVDATGRRRGGLRYTRFARSVDGRLLSIMRPDLELALRERLPDSVDLRFATSLAGVEDGPDGVRVTLADGQALSADLLVGADGIHSTVRRLVVGEERDHLRYLGFHTAAFTVHRAADPALPADSRAALRAEYSSLDWVVPDALAQCPPPDEVYYDQVAQIQAPRWRRGRVVLVGDAAYAVSLLAGQGASLAVAVETVLDDYEQLWRPVAEEKQRAGRDAIRWCGHSYTCAGPCWRCPGSPASATSSPGRWRASPRRSSPSCAVARGANPRGAERYLRARLPVIVRLL
jgi:2-polyprenyl-6-methoxyphenol hydroxylase-like FAD-dependent oxidoreductase